MNTWGEATPFTLTTAELERLLAAGGSSFPELDAARHNLGALRAHPRMREALALTAPVMATIGTIPQTTYSHARAYERSGERAPYQDPYYRKRDQLHAAALRLFLGERRAGEADLLDAVHDHLWAICQEDSWVLPAHGRVIDLAAAETAGALAEVVALLGDTLDLAVRRRVRAEIERRVFAPFLASNYDLRWFNGGDNWNGVCSGAIGMAFLLLEEDRGRLARALALLLESLHTFLGTAFNADGSSSEGVGYWQYGLMYVVVLAEMLRARTGGALDLLAAPRLRAIAGFPDKMLLPGGKLASFADSAEVVPLTPGIFARLAERTGEASLLNLLAAPTPLAEGNDLLRIFRNLLWWDGARRDAPSLADATLPALGVVRLTGRTTAGAPLAVVLKAGHNDENHNHNDVGSLIVNVAGEALLTDPGPGRYERGYFDATRYASPYANSYGHGVPQIAGERQGTGRAFAGQLLPAAPDDGATRQAAVEFARAYPVPTLVDARRRVTLAMAAGATDTLWIADRFAFADAGAAIEEAFVSWLPTEIAGDTATVRGERHALRLTIEQPTGAAFTLETIDPPRNDDRPATPLNRLAFAVPPAPAATVRVRLDILPL